VKVSDGIPRASERPGRRSRKTGSSCVPVRRAQDPRHRPEGFVTGFGAWRSQIGHQVPARPVAMALSRARSSRQPEFRGVPRVHGEGKEMPWVPGFKFRAQGWAGVRRGAVRTPGLAEVLAEVLAEGLALRSRQTRRSSLRRYSSPGGAGPVQQG
jgi:hypothetical protein